MVNELRPYQKDIRAAVMDSVYDGKGLTFTVEIARQGGKNELSAWIEAQLLSQNIPEPRNLVKCSPTFLPFVFTQPSKSQLGFNLLAAVNAGRLKMYAGDGSAEYREFWTEMERARSYYRPSNTLNFYVDPAQGHDGFLMSLALAVEAAARYEPRVAWGRSSVP